MSSSFSTTTLPNNSISTMVENSTQPAYPGPASAMPKTTRVIFQVLFGATGIWTCIICSLIIATLHFGSHRQTRKSSKLLVSLAFTGVFASSILIPWEIFGPILPTNHYEASYWLCKICCYITAASLAANELSELLVILDESSTNIRFSRDSKSLPDIKPTHVSFAIMALWAFSLIYNIHIFITHGYDPYYIKADLCGPFMGKLEVQMFFVLDTFIFYFIPVIAWFCLLARIRYHLYADYGQLWEQKAGVTTEKEGKHDAYMDRKYHTAHHSYIVICFTYAAFVVCQFPLVVLTYMQEFESHHGKGYEIHVAIAKLLSYTFNWLSPAMSALTRSDVRIAMAHLFGFKNYGTGWRSKNSQPRKRSTLASARKRRIQQSSSEYATTTSGWPEVAVSAVIPPITATPSQRQLRRGSDASSKASHRDSIGSWVTADEISLSSNEDENASQSGRKGVKNLRRQDRSTVHRNSDSSNSARSNETQTTTLAKSYY